MLKADEFDRRDVMVGVLRNRVQLEYNVKYGFYHIPEEWVPERRFPINWVAIYQAATMFPKEETGVYLYGRVRDIELVPRSEIKIPTRQNLKKLYYKMHVDGWQTLEKPVAIGAVTPPVNMFTSMYQLRNAADTAELALEKREYWDFYHTCRQMFPGSRVLAKYGRACGVKFGGLCALWESKRVMIKRGRRTLEKIRAEKFREIEYDVLLERLAAKQKKGV